MAIVSGKVSAYSSILYAVSNLPNPYNIPINIPDVISGPLADLNYTNGTGALQFDIACSYKLSLASTTQTFDLTSLADVLGLTVNMARVRECWLYNPTVTAGFDVSMYAGATNGWGILPPSTTKMYARANGGFIRISDPNSTGGGNGNVTGGASKTVTVDTGTHTVTFYLVFLGGSAA